MTLTGNRDVSAGVAICRACDGVRNRNKLGDGVGDRCLADQQVVGVVGVLAHLELGKRDAHGEARTNDRIEHVKLVRFERSSLVVSADDVSSGGQRVGLPEHRVGGSDAEPDDPWAPNNIAVVDQRK